MEFNRDIFLRLLVGAFGLTFLAFVVRGTTTIAFGVNTAETISAPLFFLAILTAFLGFVLGVAVKLRLFFGERT